jgi:hypothetical protein
MKVGRPQALRRDARGLRRATLSAQAVYFTITGVWPLLHRRSFERITGPKSDFWLVQTVGALVAVVGFVIGRAAATRRHSDGDVLALAAGSALALGTLETYYAARRRISVVYLLDAALELAFIGGLIWRRSRREERPTDA